mmetsp:Transcript_13050/g.30014  ORF Transcript_13050/g.30014 Transcript_13050/m.30014 type:complete len:290 (-) Transcript_13050:2606-3475(-)
MVVVDDVLLVADPVEARLSQVRSSAHAAQVWRVVPFAEPLPQFAEELVQGVDVLGLELFEEGEVSTGFQVLVLDRLNALPPVEKTLLLRGQEKPVFLGKAQLMPHVLQLLPKPLGLSVKRRLPALHQRVPQPEAHERAESKGGGKQGDNQDHCPVGLRCLSGADRSVEVDLPARPYDGVLQPLLVGQGDEIDWMNGPFVPPRNLPPDRLIVVDHKVGAAQPVEVLIEGDRAGCAVEANAPESILDLYPVKDHVALPDQVPNGMRDCIDRVVGKHDIDVLLTSVHHLLEA